jgi:hypothetical protein
VGLEPVYLLTLNFDVYLSETAFLVQPSPFSRILTVNVWYSGQREDETTPLAVVFVFDMVGCCRMNSLGHSS